MFILCLVIPILFCKIIKCQCWWFSSSAALQQWWGNTVSNNTSHIRYLMHKDATSVLTAALRCKGDQDECNITFVLLVIDLVWPMSPTWHQTRGQSEMAGSHVKQLCSSTRHNDSVSGRCNPMWQDAGQAGGQAATAAMLRSVQDCRASLIVYAHSRRQHWLRPQSALHSDSLYNPWLAEADWIGFCKGNKCIDPSEPDGKLFLCSC